MISKNNVQRISLRNHASQGLNVEVGTCDENCSLEFIAGTGAPTYTIKVAVDDLIKLGEFLSGKKKK